MPCEIHVPVFLLYFLIFLAAICQLMHFTVLNYAHTHTENFSILLDIYLINIHSFLHCSWMMLLCL